MDNGGRRFSDRGDDPGSRLGPDAEVLVRCPRCGCRAMARSTTVTCGRCAYVRTDDPSWRHRVELRRDADGVAYCGLPLWLQTPCWGQVLWAYDADHLDFLERYVRASIRERQPNRNTSLASRLPAWLKDAKHRRDVLAAIGRLRATL